MHKGFTKREREAPSNHVSSEDGLFSKEDIYPSKPSQKQGECSQNVAMEIMDPMAIMDTRDILSEFDKLDEGNA